MTAMALGSLLKFIRNGMNVRQDKSGDGLPITRIETISDSVIDATRVGYAGLTEQDAANWLLEPGDILFSHINSVQHIGKCAVYRGQPTKLVHGMNLLCMRTDRAKLDPEFAKYLIGSRQFRDQLSKSIKKAVNQASVSIGDLQAIHVTVPSLDDQRRIADILDRADALRAKRRAALAQLDTLTQSIFLDMFDDPTTNSKRWPTAHLGSLTRENDTINYGVVQPGDEMENGVPIVRVGDLVDGRVRPHLLKRIAPSIEAQYKRSRLRGSEILISCVGTIGVVALADSSLEGFNIARAVARVALGDSVNRRFIAEYLRSRSVQRYFVSELRTVSQPTLNIKQISETLTILPPLSLQNEFGARAAAVDTIRAKFELSLDGLTNLFESLQHRAFKGDL